MAAQIAAAQTAETIKVKVNAPFRVVHEGVAYADGDVIEVPHDDEHDTWLKAKWVTLVAQRGQK